MRMRKITRENMVKTVARLTCLLQKCIVDKVSIEGRQTTYRWTRLRLNFSLVVVGKHFEHIGSSN